LAADVGDEGVPEDVRYGHGEVAGMGRRATAAARVQPPPTFVIVMATPVDDVAGDTYGSVDAPGPGLLQRLTGGGVRYPTVELDARRRPPPGPSAPPGRSPTRSRTPIAEVAAHGLHGTRIRVVDGQDMSGGIPETGAVGTGWPGPSAGR